MRPRLRTPIIALALLTTACAGAPDVGGPEPPPPEGWRVGTAEHLALWYHGLAYTATEDDRRVLPRFDPEYVPGITARKRELGAYPTPLDERAEEFSRRFAADDVYVALEFVPLYFRSLDALMSAIALWDQAGGNPRRAGSASAAQVVAFFSSLFPRAEQRRTVVEWAQLLRDEYEAFYRDEWQARQPSTEARVAAVQQEIDAIVDAASNYLAYVQLGRGELFLVPALGVEGRTVTGGVAYPRIAILEPPTTRAEDAALATVHEWLYPLVGDVITEYLAPARIRELGEDVLAESSAVRGGAILLERTMPERVDDYHRLYLRAAGRTVPTTARAREDAFADAFPLPPELEEGLEQAIAAAVAGI